MRASGPRVRGWNHPARQKAPRVSLRREATAAGCPTIVVEGGEVWKVESSVADCMQRGVMNVLMELDMVNGKPDIPDNQATIRQTKWIRAERGGFMSMHVAPGDSVVKGQAIASNSNLLTEEHSRLEAPFFWHRDRDDNFASRSAGRNRLCISVGLRTERSPNDTRRTLQRMKFNARHSSIWRRIFRWTETTPRHRRVASPE